MNSLAYHVLHEGHRTGPFDRRTIVGLRIKKTLRSEQQLEASDGSRLTVAELIGHQRVRSGSSTTARFTCSANLIDSEAGPVPVPAFLGELELRIHADVLRIAGKHRSRLCTKDGRVKLPLKDITHFHVTGSRVDLWLRDGDAPAASSALQRLSLDLCSADPVRELLQWIPDARPWPGPAAEPLPVAGAAANASVSPLLWASVIGIAMVAAIVLLVVLRPRF